jgi:hypothetical protein
MAERGARAARRAAVAAVNPDRPEDVEHHHHQGPAQRIGGIAREENRVRRKEREPPLFRGEAHEDAVDWLSRYEEIAHYNEWNVDEQLHNFGIHLEGVARRWYLSLIPAPQTFQDLRARFLVAFKPPNYDLDLETKLRSRYQEEHEPVMTYCHDVIYLCSRVDRNMGEALKVQHLLRGLKRSLVQKVYPFLDPEVHTSQDFMRLVQIQCQADLLANQPPLVSPSTPPAVLMIPPQPAILPQASPFVTEDRLKAFKKELATEFRCELSSTLSSMRKEISNDVRDVLRESRNPKPFTSKRSRDGQPICRQCHQPGHIARECDQRKCFKCNLPGHLAKSCPTPSSSVKPSN